MIFHFFTNNNCLTMKNFQKLFALILLVGLGQAAHAQRTAVTVGLGGSMTYLTDLSTVSLPGGYLSVGVQKSRLFVDLQGNFFTKDNQVSVRTVEDVEKFYHFSQKDFGLHAGFAIVQHKGFSIAPTVGLLAVRRTMNLPAAFTTDVDNKEIVMSFAAESKNHTDFGVSAGLVLQQKLGTHFSVKLWGGYQHYGFDQKLGKATATQTAVVRLGVDYQF
jgi:hypothetical protein